jgi:alpha-1,3-glucan synthase
MGSFQQCVAVLLTLTGIVSAYRYDPAYTEYNLNQNQYAIDPIDYWGQWHEDVADYTPSPENWRIPFYTLFLDRYVNGDPYNDDINGTAFERDPNSNQMRHGGDLEGLISSLDYIQGMGIKVSRLILLACGIEF